MKDGFMTFEECQRYLDMQLSNMEFDFETFPLEWLTNDFLLDT